MSSFSFSNLTADLTLNVIQFLNVVDSGRLALTCQRQYYLVQQYRQQRGAELVAVANADLKKQNSDVVDTTNKIRHQCVNALQTRPNLILGFSSHHPEAWASRLALQETFSPDPNDPKTVVLGTLAPAIQANNAQQENSTDNIPMIEYTSTLSIMAANFPQAKIVPFHIQSMEDIDMRFLEMQLQVEKASTWKAAIVYAANEGVEIVEQFVQIIQQLLPKASIVGGISGAGYVSSLPYTRDFLMSLDVVVLREFPQCSGAHFVEKREMVDCILENPLTTDSLSIVNGGIYGVVLGGEAPVRSMVSRGVKSVFHGKPRPFSNYEVHEAQTVEPSNPDYLFRTDGSDEFLHPYHLINQIKDTETNEVLTVPQFLTKPELCNTEFIGIRRQGRDGFELESVSPYSSQLGAFLIHTDGTRLQTETLQGAQLDFFFLDGPACMEDMDETVAKLKEQTKGEEILGAVMFSCNGRGPKSGYLIPEEMADAKRFATGFPRVPCLGFYAGGEIGPLALAGNEKVFQTGRAAVQGFTAVFALFIVPKIDKINFQLDDSEDNIRVYVTQKLG